LRDVVVITPDFPPGVGGIQTLTYKLISAFERYEPHVVALPALRDLELDRTLPFSIARSRDLRLGRRAAALSLNVVGVQEALHRRPDVILGAHILAGPAALTASAILRKPAVIYAHGQELVAHPSVAGHILRRADGVVAVSAFTQRLVQQAGVSPENIRVIHPGVDEVKSAPVADHTEMSVVIVARLVERYKGHDVLFRAMARVRRGIPEARLHVVGDGPLRHELERLADGLSIAEGTIFHGRVTDGERSEILSRSTAFAMPSRIDSRGAGEGFGIVYLEAGAHGLPVVAGWAGGAADAVVDGKTGFLVDPENPDAVARAVAVLLSDATIAARMGREGRRRARAHSWHRAAGFVEDLFDEVTSR
jgi:phosphatidyl-myo-inositol dimannoside synthase